MKKLMFICFCTLFLQSCSTPYQLIGLRGGYSEIQLDENVFKVSFSGNGYTSRERATDFTLLRCAEITLEKGFEYFAVIDSDSYVSTSSHTTPTTSNTSVSAYKSGDYIYGNATTTTYGGKTYEVSKPRSINTIVLFKEKPNSIFSYNAKIVCENIKRKYGMKESLK